MVVQCAIDGFSNCQFQCLHSPITLSFKHMNAHLLLSDRLLSAILFFGTFMDMALKILPFLTGIYTYARCWLLFVFYYTDSFHHMRHHPYGSNVDATAITVYCLEIFRRLNTHTHTYVSKARA